MVTVPGTGRFTYDAVAGWERLPAGMTLHETAGVAVDSEDYVYLLTRNTGNPVIVLAADGEFQRTFGSGTFTNRTHAILVAPDGFVWCADDGAHTITKWTPEGELLLTLGTPGNASPRFSGEPFNRPTDIAVSSRDGRVFVSDGYGNARVHRYSPEGDLELSWGSPGIGPGQFMVPHNLAIDDEDRIYVADRESHRVQIFDTEGALLGMWNNIHRPCGLTSGPDGNIYIGELNGVALMDGAEGVGHRLTVLSREGDLLAQVGDPREGEEPGQFIAPHGVAVDSSGDVYVAEVSYTIRGRHLDPPREMKSINKLKRTG
jgi:DNA-binding beta-propeller fold protein YncE